MNKLQLKESIRNVRIQLNKLGIEHNYSSINLDILKVSELKNIYDNCIKLRNNYYIELANRKSNRNFDKFNSQLERVKYEESNINKFNEFKNSYRIKYNNVIEYNNSLKDKTYIVKPKIFNETLDNRSDIHNCPVCKSNLVFQNRGKNIRLNCCSDECEETYSYQQFHINRNRKETIRSYILKHLELFKKIHTIFLPKNYSKFDYTKKNKSNKKIEKNSNDLLNELVVFFDKKNIINEEDITKFINNIITLIEYLSKDELIINSNFCIKSLPENIKQQYIEELNFLHSFTNDIFKGKGEFLQLMYKNADYPEKSGDIKILNNNGKNLIIEVKNAQPNAEGGLMFIEAPKFCANSRFNTIIKFNEDNMNTIKKWIINNNINNDKINNIISSNNVNFNLNNVNSIPHQILNVLENIDGKLYNAFAREILKKYFGPNGDIVQYLNNDFIIDNYKKFNGCYLLCLVGYYIIYDCKTPDLCVCFTIPTEQIYINNIPAILSNNDELNNFVNIINNKKYKINYEFYLENAHDRNKSWAGGLQILEK